jgi:hypothetical protein
VIGGVLRLPSFGVEHATIDGETGKAQECREKEGRENQDLAALTPSDEEAFLAGAISILH